MPNFSFQHLGSQLWLSSSSSDALLLPTDLSLSSLQRWNLILWVCYDFRVASPYWNNQSYCFIQPSIGSIRFESGQKLQGLFAPSEIPAVGSWKGWQVGLMVLDWGLYLGIGYQVNEATVDLVVHRWYIWEQYWVGEFAKVPENRLNRVLELFTRVGV